MATIDAGLTRTLEAFDSRQDPALLDKAIRLVEQAAQTAPGWSGPLAQWLQLLATLDRHIDSGWDPDDVPVTASIPPPSSNGKAGFSGIDPAAIDDTAARAQYEQALKASKDHAERYRVQHELRRIDADAMHAVETLARDRWTDSPENRKAFYDAVAAASVSESRKQRLRDLMPGI